MKVFVIVAAFLAVANCQSSMTSSEEAMHQQIRMQMLKRYISQAQRMRRTENVVESVCPGYGDKLESALGDVSSCLDEVDLDKETMCSAVKNNFERCLKPVVGMFEKCLPDKAKDLPSFLVQSSLAVTDKLCKEDGEHIFELSNQCIRTPNYRTKRCFRRIEAKLEQIAKQKVPSKSETCEFLRSLRGCLESHVTLSCGNAKTREAFLDVYDASLSPCGSGSYNNEVEDMEWGTDVKAQ